jgi:hypothetical protein
LFKLTKKASSARIILEDTTADAFKVLLSYFYEGNVELQPGASNKTVSDVLDLARRCGVYDELATWVALTLRSTLAVGNVLARLCLARSYELVELENACLAFFDKNAREVFQDVSFLKLSKVSSIFERCFFTLPKKLRSVSWFQLPSRVRRQ